MRLTRISYKEFEKSSRYWEFKDFTVSDINLIVGPNASGKTRILNVINGLALIILDKKQNLVYGAYDVDFTNKSNKFNYQVGLSNGNIIYEKLYLNNQEMFNRNKNGKGFIFSTKIKQEIELKVPKNILLISRRDEIQFPYIEYLYNWALNTMHFRFSKEQEKLTLSIVNTNRAQNNRSSSDQIESILKVFKLAVSKYRNEFLSELISDMNRIGYSIHDIDTGILHSIRIDAPLSHKLVGLRINEKDRGNAITDQTEMSDGLFRALSILINYNYFILENRQLNILLDDIGEGLDYERSTKLIELLVEKSKSSNIQLIMSTNDKFVMNNTSIDYWQVLDRKGGLVTIYNKINSPNEFEDFRFTGLSNFDFFTTDFFKTGLQ